MKYSKSTVDSIRILENVNDIIENIQNMAYKENKNDESYALATLQMVLFSINYSIEEIQKKNPKLKEETNKKLDEIIELLTTMSMEKIHNFKNMN